MVCLVVDVVLQCANQSKRNSFLQPLFRSLLIVTVTLAGESWPPSEAWYRPVCVGGGFEESVLYRHLAVKRVPLRVYPAFEYSIVRGGKRADWMGQIAGVPLYASACDIVERAGLLRPGFSQ